MKNILLFLFLLSLSGLTFSQVLSVNGATISVTKGGILSATGNLENSGEIHNSGTISVAGNWKNNLTYTDKGGIFLLNGTEQQDVFHNGQLFGILIIDAGGRKIFSSDAGVKDSLILKDGIVEIPDDYAFTLQSGAGTTKGSDISHISGVLYNTGTGYKLYPVGAEGEYAPAELYELSGDNPTVGIEVINFNPNIEFDEDLSAVSELRYWKAEELSGNDFDAKIALSFDTDYDEAQIENLVVAEAENPEGTYTGVGKNEAETLVNISGIISERKISKPYFALAYIYAEGNEFYIPNTFSPRATAEEDKCLRIYGKYFKKENFQFSVYNKWGNLIYKSNSLEELQTTGWDGKNQKTGKIEEFGMYSYIIKGKTLDGKTIEKTNTVLIME